MENEPQKITLEEYKNVVSLYRNYREKISEFNAELTGLKEQETSLSVGFFIGSYVLFYIVSFSVILFLFFRGDTQNDFWGNFIFSIFIAFIAFCPAFILEIIFNNYFINNLLSFGKLDKLKRQQKEIGGQIKEVEELKIGIYEKIHSFEKNLCEHYLAKIVKFFEENLYKKSSGSPQFEEVLSEFSSTIEELASINSILITTHIPLEEYREYLRKRTVNHNLQATKNNETLNSIRNFAKSFSEPQKPKEKEFVAPERLYRIARKIDNWEEINKKRKMTGLKGEEIIVVIEQEFLESIGRNDLAQKVRHISAENGDGLGYDVLSFFENGIEKYIEVKSTTASLSSPFYLSRNELGFLKEHSEDAFIYRVLISGDEPRVKTDSSREFLEKNDLIPTIHCKSKIKFMTDLDLQNRTY